ncbi:hypothetical protein EYF80_034348 [Liparis tanakae]|uniref:MADF domain-containing protein n=1 Tax=Liparis tanakae TaxID=230148 RepID=A0A4Z2GPV6_9TELE|nr:hypothetical protein EYF80_034348 [Liparis tanakae]
MDQTEERLIEEVKKYHNLYSYSARDYKDCKITLNSWREISQTTGLEVAECAKRWKNLRDKYVRLRKRLDRKGGDPSSHRVPAFYHLLSWLAPHVKHRQTDSNYESTTCGLSETETASTSISSPTEPGESPVSRRKRKRKHQDDQLVEEITHLGQRGTDLQADECSRFGQTVADLLRRVPEDKRPDLMFKVYGLIIPCIPLYFANQNEETRTEIGETEQP